jgi:hypothetical protein
MLADDEYDADHVFIIDGAVSARNMNDKHWQLIREIMRLPAAKVVEHPDLFVQQTEYTLDDFDYIIELKSHRDEEITYEALKQDPTGFGNLE